MSTFVCLKYTKTHFCVCLPQLHTKKLNKLNKLLNKFMVRVRVRRVLSKAKIAA